MQVTQQAVYGFRLIAGRLELTLKDKFTHQLIVAGIGFLSGKQVI
jgi:hypothetical protein